MVTEVDDRRRKARSAVNIKAWADPGGVAPVKDCTIVDLSESGACIAAATADALPETFDIVLDTKRIIGKARVVWRAADAVGVRIDRR